MSSQPPPPTVVRKGRGAFKQSLHSSAPQQESSQGELSGREAGERFAFAFEKPMRPIDVTGAELGEAETARVQLFRKERRKRQIIIVGDVGKLASVGICKLFGHRGPKPLRLQDKWIRLVHIAMPFDRHEEENQNVERQDVHGNGAERSAEAVRTVVEGGESTETEKTVEHTDALDGEASSKPTATVEGVTETAATAAPCEEYEKKPFVSQSSQHSAFLSSSAPSELSSEPDRVRPLTVDVGGMVTAISSPVLTSLRFHTLTPFFLEQLHQLWKLEDIAKQRVQIHLNFGTGYVCANNNSRMVHDANFPELVDKWNDEALQLHFIKDCPPCVSRAVDATCGKDVVGSRHYSVAKLTFFSQDRQSRTIARALWNGDMNAFELVDVESVGVTFTWTVFSVDDKQHCHSAEEVALVAQEQHDDGGDNHGKKTVAFPVELGFRAFYRSKDVSAHATTGTAKAVLAKLTEAEHNIIRHGSASQYDAMDLSAVCEIDVNSHDQKLEHIQIEHVEQKKLRCGLLIESSNCLNIEGFESSVSQRTKSYRNAGHDTQDSWQLKQDGSDRGARDSGALSFFRTRTNMVHWKIDADRTIPENLALLDDAFYFAGRVLHKANAISTHDARGGAAPEAI